MSAPGPVARLLRFVRLVLGMEDGSRKSQPNPTLRVRTEDGETIFDDRDQREEGDR